MTDIEVLIERNRPRSWTAKIRFDGYTFIQVNAASKAKVIAALVRWTAPIKGRHGWMELRQETRQLVAYAIAKAIDGKDRPLGLPYA